MIVGGELKDVNGATIGASRSQVGLVEGEGQAGYVGRSTPRLNP